MDDALKRQFSLPPHHIPYLEKHRIYQLFHELSRELIIQQPEDHVIFLKQILSQAAKSINVARVVILSSPRINVSEIGRLLSVETGQYLFTDEILSKLSGKAQLNSKEIIYILQHILRNQKVIEKGWILTDVIKTKDMAQALIKSGFLPTHVLHLISPYNPNLKDLLYCNVSENWPDYRRTVLDVRDVFTKKLIEVPLQEMLMLDVVKKCADLVQTPLVGSELKVPRVIILGPRGSGRKTQAKLLQEKYGIIHVEFEDLFCLAWQSDSELGVKLQACGNKACFHSDLLAEVLNERILKDDCLIKGWVLTNFPFNANDFRYIDCLPTPPNRVIFLDIDLNICKERIVGRRFNAYTGSEIKLETEKLFNDMKQKLLNVHPKDDADNIMLELKYYCREYGELREYCGQTAHVVNADQAKRWVFEYICSAIDRDSPICPPRDPLQKISAIRNRNKKKDENKLENNIKTLLEDTSNDKLIPNTYIVNILKDSK